jgi:hypothetical protein
LDDLNGAIPVALDRVPQHFGERTGPEAILLTASLDLSGEQLSQPFDREIALTHGTTSASNSSEG